MLHLRTFRAWRPIPEKAHRLGSRSYVAYTPDQLVAKLDGNPYTFLHVIHTDQGRDAHLSRADRLRRVQLKFKAFCDLGYLCRDAEPCLYVYEQTNRGVASLGIIAGVSVADYRQGLIKVHEQTLTAREALFTDYLDATGINAEPVLLAAPDDGGLEYLLTPITRTAPDSDFVTGDGVRHRTWAVADPTWRLAVQELFATLPALYIADGHHRWPAARGWPRPQVAVVNVNEPLTNPGIYVSADSGVTWTGRETVRYWTNVTSSADGTRLAAVNHNGSIFTSVDSGTTWQIGAFGRYWNGIASSADGSKLAAVVLNGQIFTTTNSGLNWTARESNRLWQAVASSADGTRLAAGAVNGNIYVSSDSGLSWTPGAPSRGWSSIASSADGSKLAAVAFDGGDRIYTSAGTLAPHSISAPTNSGAYSASAFATDILAGPPDESTQAVSFTVSGA